MTVKVVVLYPHPKDEAEFERYYVGTHLPLMRKLLGPDVPLPTYKTMSSAGDRAPYYRVAEIHFPDMDSFTAYVSDRDKLEEGRASMLSVSTGGEPTVLVCNEQEPI